MRGCLDILISQSGSYMWIRSERLLQAQMRINFISSSGQTDAEQGERRELKDRDAETQTAAGGKNKENKVRKERFCRRGLTGLMWFLLFVWFSKSDGALGHFRPQNFDIFRFILKLLNSLTYRS